MKKIILLLCITLLFCAGCGEVPVPAPSTETNDPVEELPVYLELHFGNGEVLRKEIAYVEIPDSFSGGDICTGFEYRKFYNSTYEGDYYFWDVTVDGYFERKSSLLALSVAVFTDGQKYALHDIKDTGVDRNSRALIVHLWRDEPYQTEREYFETVGIKED